MARVSNIVALKVSDIMFHHTIIGNSPCEYMVLRFEKLKNAEVTRVDPNISQFTVRPTNPTPYCYAPCMSAPTVPNSNATGCAGKKHNEKCVWDCNTNYYKADNVRSNDLMCNNGTWRLGLNPLGSQTLCLPPCGVPSIANDNDTAMALCDQTVHNRACNWACDTYTRESKTALIHESGSWVVNTSHFSEQCQHGPQRGLPSLACHQLSEIDQHHQAPKNMARLAVSIVQIQSTTDRVLLSPAPGVNGTLKSVYRRDDVVPPSQLLRTHMLIGNALSMWKQAKTATWFVRRATPQAQRTCGMSVIVAIGTRNTLTGPAPPHTLATQTRVRIYQPAPFSTPRASLPATTRHTASPARGKVWIITFPILGQFEIGSGYPIRTCLRPCTTKAPVNNSAANAHCINTRGNRSTCIWSCPSNWRQEGSAKAVCTDGTWETDADWACQAPCTTAPTFIANASCTVHHRPDIRRQCGLIPCHHCSLRKLTANLSSCIGTQDESTCPWQCILYWLEQGPTTIKSLWRHPFGWVGYAGQSLQEHRERTRLHMGLRRQLDTTRLECYELPHNQKSQWTLQGTQICVPPGVSAPVIANGAGIAACANTSVEGRCYWGCTAPWRPAYDLPGSTVSNFTTCKQGLSTSAWDLVASQKCFQACSTQPTILHLNQTKSNCVNTQHGKTCARFCQTDYIASGSTTLTCNEGRWQYTDQICYAPCRSSSLPDIEFISSVAAATTLHGTSVGWSCRPNHIRTGPTTILCSNGAWQVLPTMQCFPPCGPLPLPNFKGQPCLADPTFANRDASQYQDQCKAVRTSFSNPSYHFTNLEGAKCAVKRLSPSYVPNGNAQMTCSTQGTWVRVWRRGVCTCALCHSPQNSQRGQCACEQVHTEWRDAFRKLLPGTFLRDRAKGFRGGRDRRGGVVGLLQFKRVEHFYQPRQTITPLNSARCKSGVWVTQPTCVLDPEKVNCLTADPGGANYQGIRPCCGDNLACLQGNIPAFFFEEECTIPCKPGCQLVNLDKGKSEVVCNWGVWSRGRCSSLAECKSDPFIDGNDCAGAPCLNLPSGYICQSANETDETFVSQLINAGKLQCNRTNFRYYRLDSDCGCGSMLNSYDAIEDAIKDAAAYGSDKSIYKDQVEVMKYVCTSNFLSFYLIFKNAVDTSDKKAQDIAENVENALDDPSASIRTVCNGNRAFGRHGKHRHDRLLLLGHCSSSGSARVLGFPEFQSMESEKIIIKKENQESSVADMAGVSDGEGPAPVPQSPVMEFSALNSPAKASSSTTTLQPKEVVVQEQRPVETVISSGTSTQPQAEGTHPKRVYRLDSIAC
eukprot:g80525.t1